MTEQSSQSALARASNDILEATSFLSGTNAAFVEQLYERWQANPNSVDQTWQDYFASLGERNLSATQLGRGPEWARGKRPTLPTDDTTLALTGQTPLPSPKKADGKGKPADAASAVEAAKHSIHAVQMIRAGLKAGG